MTLQQLRFLCMVVDSELNISRAAERLHTSQPGVSKQLRQLERELGVELFLRRGKHLGALTEVGQRIVQQARGVMQGVAAIGHSAEEALDESSGRLGIATTHTQSRYLLPQVISRFVRRYPGVALHMQQGTPMQIAELASRGEADFAIATEALDRFDNLLVLPCFRWNRVVLVPAGHPLTEIGQLTLEALARYPLVTYVHGFTGREKLDLAFRERGLEPDVVFTASDADVIKTYVRLGTGVGVIASMAVEAERDSDLVALDASGLFEWSTTSIGLRRESCLRGYMYEFIELFAPQLDRRTVERFIRAGENERQAIRAGLPVPSLQLAPAQEHGG